MGGGDTRADLAAWYSGRPRLQKDGPQLNALLS